MRLVWDAPDERPYHAGVDRGVIYPPNRSAVTWDGLVEVKEAEDDADTGVIFFDGRTIRQRKRPGDFAGTIQAYTAPEELEQFNGVLDLSWRTGGSNSYIHLAYNVLLVPQGITYQTINNSPEASLPQWDFKCAPQAATGYAPSSHIVIDTTSVYPWVMSQVEDILYGYEGVEPRAPQLDELYAIFDAGAILKITDHGDGTWTADGPDEVVSMLDADTFQIAWPSAQFISPTTYTVRTF